MKWNGWTILWGLFLSVGITIPFRGGFNLESFICTFIWFIIFTPILLLNLYLLNNPKCIENKRKRKEIKARIAQEKRDRNHVKWIKEAEEKFRQDRLKREREAFKKRDNNPVKAKFLCNAEEFEAKFSAAGGLLGGMLAGPIGALAFGSALGDKNTKYQAVFTVEYETGRRGTETVEINSARFCLLTSLIPLD